jgi:hypothetical protein
MLTNPFNSLRAVHESLSWRARVQGSVAASVVVGTLVLVGSSGIAGAAAITPAAYCKKISATTVGSLYGGKTPLLGALTEGTGNDVCEFATIVSGTVSGATMNYDYKGTGTVAADIAALKKEKGVTDPVFKTYASIGGTTYSFTDTFTNSATKKSIKESGMVSYNGANHYGLVVTKVLGTSTLAKLMELVVKAA